MQAEQLIKSELGQLLSDNGPMSQVIDIVKRTAGEAGMDAYLVGGFVRDLFLAKPSDDLDFMTPSIPSQEIINRCVNIVMNNQFYTRKFDALLSTHRESQQEKRSRGQDADIYLHTYDDVFRQAGGSLCLAILCQQNDPGQSKNIEIFSNTMTVMISLLGLKVEFAHARSEDYTISRLQGDQEVRKRRPEVEKADNIKQDAKRRDFTINSLMIDLSTFNVLDLTGTGLSDLEHGIIRTTSDETDHSRKEIFIQDPLRIIRAARFTGLQSYRPEFNYLNFTITPETIQAMKNAISTDVVTEGFMIAPDKQDIDYYNPPKTKELRRNRDEMAMQINPSAYKGELEKIMLGQQPSQALSVLGEVGFLRYISQHLQQLYDDEKECQEYARQAGLSGYHCHKDNWTHTLDVVDSATLTDDIIQAIKAYVYQTWINTKEGQDTQSRITRNARLSGLHLTNDEAKERTIEFGIEKKIKDYQIALRMAGVLHDVAKVRSRVMGHIQCPQCKFGEIPIKNVQQEDFRCPRCKNKFQAPNVGNWIMQRAHNARKGTDKVHTYKKPPFGISINPTFIGHELQGSNIAQMCLEHLGMGREIRDIVHIINKHGVHFGTQEEQANEFENVSEKTIERIMRQLSGYDPGLDQHVELAEIRRLLAMRFKIADMKAWKREKAQQNMDLVEQRFQQMMADRSAEERLQEQIVDGNTLMDTFGLSPGPWIGETHRQIRSLLENAKDDQDTGKEAQLQIAANVINKHMSGAGQATLRIQDENKLQNAIQQYSGGTIAKPQTSWIRYALKIT